MARSDLLLDLVEAERRGDRERFRILVEAVIADVNPETRRLSLSLRATEPNPWEQLAEKFRIGDRVQGVVRNLTDFGAFVEIEEGIDGLVQSCAGADAVADGCVLSQQHLGTFDRGHDGNSGRRLVVVQGFGGFLRLTHNVTV